MTQGANAMTDDKVAVTQEARVLAAALARWSFPNTPGAGEGIEDGQYDQQENVQLVARFEAQARLAGERAGMPDVHYDELAIQHGQQVTVTFKDPADAFALFNEIRERGQDAIRKEAASIAHPGD